MRAVDSRHITPRSLCVSRTTRRLKTYALGAVLVLGACESHGSECGMGYCDPPARAYLHDQGPRDVVPPWDYQRLVFVVDPGREFQLQDLEAVSQPPGAFDVEIVSVYRRWPQYLEEPEEVSMCRDSGDFATFAVDCLLPLSAELEGFEAEVRRSQSHDPARPAVGELRVHHNGLLTAVPLRLGPPEPRIAYADIALPCADEQERRSLLLKVENIGLCRSRSLGFEAWPSTSTRPGGGRSARPHWISRALVSGKRSPWPLRSRPEPRSPTR